VALGRFRGTPVAVKAPRLGTARSNLKIVASLCNELRVLRRIRHSHIVAFHGAAIDPVSSELAMIYEYVDGESMDDFVRAAHARPERPETALLKVLVDIGSALGYLHGATPPIVHGDIKSTNIKVQRLGTGIPFAKLLDFGLSRFNTSAARPLGGTLSWMAPELIRIGSSSVHTMPEASADMYSFGLLAHYTVMGVHPDRSFDRLSLGSRFRRLSWADPGLLSDKFRPLCRSCISGDPGRRPTISDVQATLVVWLRASAESFDEVGAEIVAMLATASPWDEGMDNLRQELAKQEAASKQRCSKQRFAGKGPTSPGSSDLVARVSINL